MCNTKTRQMSSFETMDKRVYELLFTHFLIENAHSIDLDDFDIVVYLENNHSFITLFLQK
jgi:hypothetical protein